MNIKFYGTIEEEIQSQIEEAIENDYVGGEFSVMTEEEREEKVKEHIRESLWAFNSWFILNHTKESINNNRVEKALKKMQEELCEDANELVYALIEDFDSFVEDAVNADGYGHFLSPYDGEENELVVDGKTYYIYRTN